MLKLKLEDLAVESFASTETPTRRGTVQAHQYSYTCDFNVCGGTNPTACETNMLGCGTGGGSCDQFCTGGDYTCYEYRTCAAPCGISDATNCHHCTENQTGVSYCQDPDSLCIC